MEWQRVFKSNIAPLLPSFELSSKTTFLLSKLRAQNALGYVFRSRFLQCCVHNLCVLFCLCDPTWSAMRTFSMVTSSITLLNHRISTSYCVCYYMSLGYRAHNCYFYPKCLHSSALCAKYILEVRQSAALGDLPMRVHNIIHDRYLGACLLVL